MLGTYINGDGKEIGVLRQRGRWCGCKDGAGKARARESGMAPDRHRQGKGNAMMLSPKR
jgi:hypothetical protein